MASSRGSCAPERRVAVPLLAGHRVSPPGRGARSIGVPGPLPQYPGTRAACARPDYGIRWRWPLAGLFSFPQEEDVNDAQELTSREGIDVADPWGAIETCYAKGWTDGLPVVP